LNRIVKRRLAAIEARRHDVYVAPDMGFLVETIDALDADRDGRLYSSLPDDHPARLARYPPISDEREADPTSPGAQLLRRMLDLRKRMEESGEVEAWRKHKEQARRDTIKAIEAENRHREKRERMRAKKARRKERQRLAESDRVAFPTGH
jgi:hypothetical protein